MNKPIFTVIIPTYNRAGMLREAIQSVLDQTFQDFELIVVDDHSPDITKEVVASIPDSRIKYIVNDHLKGNSGARNAGIFRAQGEWVAFLDDDDTWLPQKLELVHNKICTIENDVGLIYTGFVYCNFDTGQQISTHVPEKKGHIQNDLLVDNYIGTPSAVSVRTNMLRHIGGFDERINHFEDGDLYVRIAGLSKVDFVKEILTYYRTSNKDKLSISLENVVNNFDLFAQKHSELINKNPRLRYFAASRVLRTAIKKRNINFILKALPWSLAGILFEPYHFLKTMWYIVLVIIKSRRLS